MTRATPTPETITLHVPFKLTKRGGRKLMIAPDGAGVAPRPRIDSALVKALARAHRWQRMLDSGEFATIRELAEREGVTPSFLTRILRLTLLAPDIAETILHGKQSETLTLKTAMEPFPGEWAAQASHFDGRDPCDF